MPHYFCSWPSLAVSSDKPFLESSLLKNYWTYVKGGRWDMQQWIAGSMDIFHLKKSFHLILHSRPIFAIFVTMAFTKQSVFRQSPCCQWMVEQKHELEREHTALNWHHDRSEIKIALVAIFASVSVVACSKKPFLWSYPSRANSQVQEVEGRLAALEGAQWIMSPFL